MTNRMMRATAVIAFWMLFAAAPAAANDFMHQGCLKRAEDQYAHCMDRAARTAERRPANSPFNSQMDERRCEAVRASSIRQCETQLRQRDKMRPNNRP